jgi:signal transduction histidine kinase
LGTTKYTPEQTDIYLLSNNIISLLRLNAEEKDIVISSRMNRDLIGWVDENLFNTVLRNLLSNAIKFSRVGSMIQVTGVVEGDMIKISVADSGVGIRQEDLEKLFDIGTNISTKGTFNEKGTGLGLMLCKEFVEINQGTIWAESVYGNGSTFHFTVPKYDETKHKKQ